MQTINNIFSKEKNINKSGSVQKIKYNREHLLSKDVAQELNTYLNFGIFPVYADTQPDNYEYDAKNKKWVKTKDSQKAGSPGVRSIFNRAGAVLLGSTDGEYNVDITDGNSGVHWLRICNNVPLMDSPRARQRIRESSGCSIKELVQASAAGRMGQETYAYSDFMYCKNLGRISNNYMITLRRFPFPVDDYIGAMGEDMNDVNALASNNASCIGCMVTWLGTSGNEMSSILKYDYKMPFKLETAERQDISGSSADSNNTLLGGISSVLDPKYREQYQEGYAGTNANDALSKVFKIKGLGNPPYSSLANQEDRLKVYGPVDSIRSTYVRSDAGLEFNQSFTLTFEYELRSYNGINGKQAMLDLISNILNVTYTTGTFWGGGYKGFAAHQSNIFTNLNIFKTKGGFTDFVDDFSKDMADMSDKIGGFTWKGAMQTLNQVGGMIMSGLLNSLGRPQKSFYNSLLSPAPIGFWHVTIGNPRKPIMSIGNMIVTGCTIEHQGPLGLDDFPTGLKVTVQLDRGKPRDLRDIEKLYMQGENRIYTSMGEKVFDMYKNAELYKAAKKSGNLSSYNPVSLIADEDTNTSNPTTSVKNQTELLKKMKKYFGTTDAYSIYVPAAEQESGAGKKKPSTDANKSLDGDNNAVKDAERAAIANQTNINK